MSADYQVADERTSFIPKNLSSFIAINKKFANIVPRKQTITIDGVYDGWLPADFTTAKQLVVDKSNI